MAIKKLPNGRWEASYRDPTGRERVKHHRTRTDADRWLTAVKNQLNRGDFTDPRLGRRPFSTWAADWLATMAHVRPKTHAHYESILRVHVLPAFADTPVGGITSTHVRRFIADAVARGAAPGTVRSARKVLRLVLATAVTEGAIRANPCDGVRVPASPRAEMVFLSVEQIETLASSNRRPLRHPRPPRRLHRPARR
jgi:hypothetical protein